MFSETDLKLKILTALFIAVSMAPAQAETTLNDAQMNDVLSQIAPGKSIVSESRSLNDPLIYFVIQGGEAKVSDTEKEDVFTKEKTYSYSEIYCTIKIVFFTPSDRGKVYVGSDAGETFPQTLSVGLSSNGHEKNYNFWVGGFSSSNMLETKINENGVFSIKPGKTTGTSQVPAGKFNSRSEAEQAANTACSLNDVHSVELYNMGFGSDGILLEGNSERIPFYGNSTVIVMN